MPDVAAGCDRAELLCGWSRSRSAAGSARSPTIWYGRITSRLRSTSKTQYLVRMLSSVCLAKNVFVKPVRSAIAPVARVGPPARELEACSTSAACRAPPRLLGHVRVAGGVGVVLRLRAVADHEELDVLEQAGAGPEAVALVAVDLVERLADVHAAPLELDVHQRQAVDEDGDVVAVRALAPPSTPTSYWLMTCSRLLWMFRLSISRMFLTVPSSRARTWTWSSWIRAVFSTMPSFAPAIFSVKNRCHSASVNSIAFSASSWARRLATSADSLGDRAGTRRPGPGGAR